MKSLLNSVVISMVGWLVLTSGLWAQTTLSFSEVTPPNDPWFVTPEEEDFWINSIAPADVDSDGDLDLAVIGFYVVYNVSAEDKLLVFLNEGADANGNWVFTAVDVPLGNVYAGQSDLAWGDFDGDGDPDLAVASEGATVVYRNDGGTLIQLPNELSGYWEDSAYTIGYDFRSVSWADYDNDNDLDLLIPSVFDFDIYEYRTDIARNDGPDGSGGWLFTNVPGAVEPTVHAQTGWADTDADGDLDLFLLNNDNFLDTGYLRIYQNDQGTFSVGTDLGIKVDHGNADWGDYDADGDMDIVVCGNIQEVNGTYDTVLRIYTNEGGNYVPNTLIDSPNADWLDLLAATWADYDSDGDMDLLLTGNFVDHTISEIVGKSQIFANQSGTFVPLDVLLPAPIDSIGRGGSFTWWDIDNDGDLDYLVAGAYYVPNGNGLVEAQIHLYRNDSPGTNLRPTAPQLVVADPVDDSVSISWDPAFDDTTPATALTYDLSVRPIEESSTANNRHMPQPGNLSAVNNWQLVGLADGTYVWNLKAVDSAFNAGVSAEGQFTIGQPALAISVVRTARQSTEFVGMEVTLTNNTNQDQSVDLWAELTDKENRHVNTLAPQEVFIPAGQTITQDIKHVIPNGLAPGMYREKVMVGLYPNTVIASDQFSFRLGRIGR